MGRLEKMKRFLIEEANKRLLMEQNETYTFNTEGMKSDGHKYQIESEKEGKKSIPVDKTNPRGEKKEYDTKIITLKCISPENIKDSTITVTKVCGINGFKLPRGYSSTDDNFKEYVNSKC